MLPHTQSNTDMIRLKKLSDMLCLVCLTSVFASCSSWIDEDMSDCYPTMKRSITYQILLLTNFEPEIKEKLGKAEDTEVAKSLRQHLDGIFTDNDQQLDMLFYSNHDPFELKHHEFHAMNTNRATYTVSLPANPYLHIATAYRRQGLNVETERTDNGQTASLRQQPSQGTAEPHTSAIYTTHRTIDFSKETQDVLINLYIANSAVALVIDPQGHQAQSVRVLSTGFATGFNIADSAYTHTTPSPMILTKQLTVDGGNEWCYCSANFPSDDNGWMFKAYVTLPNGSVTESILSVRKPLKAGELAIVKAYMDEEGALRTDDHQVGISVMLNWKEGMNQDVEL